MRHKDVEPDHHAGDQVSRAVDGQRIPGNQLHEQAACRETEGSGQHAGGAKGAGVGEGFGCIVHFIHIFVLITDNVKGVQLGYFSNPV